MREQLRKNILEQTAFTENNEIRPAYSIFGEQAYFEPIEQMSFFSDRLSNRSGTLFYSSGNSGASMPQTQSNLLCPEKLLHPACSWCGGPTFLTQIEPSEPDYDRRTFECSACNNTMTEIIKYK
jgi:hypothetical protein